MKPAAKRCTEGREVAELLRSYPSLRDALDALGADQLIGAVVHIDPRGRRPLRRPQLCLATAARAVLEVGGPPHPLV
jgi:hypothetical protein